MLIEQPSYGLNKDLNFLLMHINLQNVWWNISHLSTERIFMGELSKLIIKD